MNPSTIHNSRDKMHCTNDQRDGVLETVALYALDQDRGTTSSLGILHYTRQLIEALAQCPDPGFFIELWLSSTNKDILLPPSGLPHWMHTHVVKGRFGSGWRRLYADHVLPLSLARRRKIAAIHFPKGWLPALVPHGCKTVATLPDAIPDFYLRHYPDYHPLRMRYFSLLAKHTLRRADHIITLSQASRTDLSQLHSHGNPIEIIPVGGMDSAPASLSTGDRSGIMVIGSNHPHKKTHETLRLLNAYAKRRDATLTVHLTGWDSTNREDCQAYTFLTCNCLGHLNDAAFSKLLRESECLVFLSELEGFGIPLLEAYEQYTPVCYRNTTSLAEVMDGAPGGWDGQSPETFDTALDVTKSLSQAEIAEIRDNLNHRFKWPDIARRTLSVYERVLAHGSKERIPILGLPVDQVTYQTTIDRLRTWISDHRPPAPTKTVIAANVHVVTECALKPAYAKAARSADMVLPDGMPLVWATRLWGGALYARCYGPALMEHALDAFQGTSVRHFFYGSSPEVLAQLTTAVERKWPEANIVGVLSPPFGDFDDAIERCNITTINSARPDILWVAMGCPKQEFWIERYREYLGVPVALAVGAAFDFIAGTKPQAPAWMQRNGLEWLFRLCSEPRRLWRRYLIRNPYFVLQVLLQVAGLRWRQPPEQEPPRQSP